MDLIDLIESLKVSLGHRGAKSKNHLVQLLLVISLATVIGPIFGVEFYKISENTLYCIDTGQCSTRVYLCHASKTIGFALLVCLHSICGVKTFNMHMEISSVISVGREVFQNHVTQPNHELRLENFLCSFSNIW